MRLNMALAIFVFAAYGFSQDSWRQSLSSYTSENDQLITAFGKSNTSLSGFLGLPIPEISFSQSTGEILNTEFDYYSEVTVATSDLPSLSIFIFNFRNDGEPYPVTVSVEFENGKTMNFFPTFPTNSKLYLSLDNIINEIESINGWTKVTTISAFPFRMATISKIGYQCEIQEQTVNTPPVFAARLDNLDVCCHPVTSGFLRISAETDGLKSYASLMIDREWWGYDQNDMIYIARLWVFANGIFIHEPDDASWCRIRDRIGEPDLCVQPISQFTTYGHNGNSDYFTIWRNMRFVLNDTGDGEAYRPEGYIQGGTTWVIRNAD